MPGITREQTPWEVLAIADQLRQNPEGAILPYRAMDEVAGGVDVQHDRPQWHRVARRIVLEEGIDYACVPNVGLKRLSPGDALKSGELGRKTVQRSVRRTGQRLAKIDKGRLSSGEQVQLAAYMTMCATLQMTAALKSLRQYIETGRFPQIVPLTPKQLEGIFQSRRPRLFP
jgi:hypothetical protein